MSGRGVAEKILTISLFTVRFMTYEQFDVHGFFCEQNNCRPSDYNSTLSDPGGRVFVIRM
jgi:hypothetical protein